MATYVVLAKFTDTRASAMLPEAGRCFQGNGENIRGHCCSNGDVLRLASGLVKMAQISGNT